LANNPALWSQWVYVIGQSGFGMVLLSSASGYKQTFQGVSQNVRVTPESGH